MNRNVPFVLVVVFAMATRVGAGVPESICVQGYLRTLEGENVNGPVDFCAAVYDAPSGGNQVWPASGCHLLPAVPVEGGLKDEVTRVARYVGLDRPTERA